MNDKNVLLVDDDPALVEVLELRCRAIGLQTRTAHNALAALQQACREPPDVICLDVEMPGGNGLNACELLAGEPRLANVPVIVLTGKTDCDTIRRCHDVCAYYVPKCGDLWGRIEPLLRELLAPAGEGAQ